MSPRCSLDGDFWCAIDGDSWCAIERDPWCCYAYYLAYDRGEHVCLVSVLRRILKMRGSRR
jgi:hypothetical protein